MPLSIRYSYYRYSLLQIDVWHLKLMTMILQHLIYNIRKIFQWFYIDNDNDNKIQSCLYQRIKIIVRTLY